MATKKMTAATKAENTVSKETTVKKEAKATLKRKVAPAKNAEKNATEEVKTTKAETKKEEVKSVPKQKETKDSLTEYLNSHMEVIKTNKDLTERVLYTAKMWKKDKSKVDITTLRSLKKEVEQLELDMKAAASLKKPKAKSTAKETPAKEETPTVTKKEEKTKEDSAKKQKPSVVKSHSEGQIEMADSFAEEFTNDFGTFRKVDDINSYKEFVKALEDDERDLYVAFYVSKKVLRTINYSAGLTVGQPPKGGFKNDLDLTKVVYINEEKDTIIITVSLFTDAMYTICNDEVAPDKEDGVRYAGLLSYEIYELVEEAE